MQYYGVVKILRQMEEFWKETIMKPCPLDETESMN